MQKLSLQTADRRHSCKAGSYRVRCHAHLCAAATTSLSSSSLLAAADAAATTSIRLRQLTFVAHAAAAGVFACATSGVEQ